MAQTAEEIFRRSGGKARSGSTFNLHQNKGTCTAIKTCNKVQKGTMEYEINEEGRWLRLLADHPESGDVGGIFSDEVISFDAINAVLMHNDLNGRSQKLTMCFTERHSSNNAPMLAAALMDLGIIDSSYNVLGLL